MSALIGEMLASDSLIISYELCRTGPKETPEQFIVSLANFHSPMITSTKTGKRYLFPLMDLINIAVEAGIEESDQ